MKRSNFTFLVSIAFLLLWMVPNQVKAQCGAPTGIMMTALCDGTTNVSWTAGMNNQQFNVEIEVMGAPNGVVFNNVASPLNVTGLVVGTMYQVAVTGVCDPPANQTVAVGTAVILLAAPTPPATPTVTVSATAPSCPGLSDGTVTVAIAAVAGPCSGTTFGVSVGGSGSAIAAGGSATYIGYPAGPSAITYGAVTPNAGCVCTIAAPTTPTTVTVPAGTISGADQIADVFSTSTNPAVQVINDNVLVGPSPLNLPTLSSGCSGSFSFSTNVTNTCEAMVLYNVAVDGVSFIEGDPYTPGVNNPNLYVDIFDLNLGLGVHTIVITHGSASGLTSTSTFSVNVTTAEQASVTAQSINATVPQCSPSTTVCLSAAVVEACGGTVPGPGAVFNFFGSGTTVSGSAVTLGGSGASQGNGQFELCQTLMPGTYTYIFNYNGATSRGSINVNKAADDLGPVISAPSVNLEIHPCATDPPIVYNFTVSDDCAPIDINEVIAGFDPGGVTPFGPPFVVSVGNPFAVTFGFQAIANPGFYVPEISYRGVSVFPAISILQLNIPTPASLACNDQINVSLDAACMLELNADMFTEGSDLCGEGFTIKIPAAGLTLTGQSSYYVSVPAGKHQFEISYPGVDAPCWGYINVERKIVPDPVPVSRTIMCIEDRKFQYEKVSEIQALLALGCYSDVEGITYSDRDGGDLCDGTLQWIREWRGQVTIDGKKQNIILLRETVTELPLTIDMINLPLGGTFDDPVEIWCPDGTSPAEIAAHYDVKCTNADNKNDNNEGIPYAYPYLIKGEVECTTQECRDEIRETRTTERILIDGKWVEVIVITKDTVKVCDPPVTTKYPKYVKLDKGKTCNIDVKCVDMKFASCTGPDTKVMRTWTLLDWCNGTIAEHVQWIKVVDDKAPVINPGSNGKPRKLKDVTVSIAPWTCAAEYALNVNVTDNCDDDVEVKYYSSLGQIGSDNVIRGLWKDESPIRIEVTATDACGNPSTDHFYIHVVDDIPPVIIAEDQVNVSLTGDVHGTGDDLGVAKVYTNAIDAGSHDAGCGPVDLCLLLKEELENPIYHPVTLEPVFVGNKQIYHVAQCAKDGTIEFEVPDGKGTKKVPYDYVFCKDHVKFCCSDVGDNQVALVGFDHYGNYSHSWTTVTVEDKSTPIVKCADDIELECLDDYDVDRLKPTVYNALCTGSDLQSEVHQDVDACGQGYVEVIWTLDGEVVCINYFLYKGVSQFDPYNIRWPKHYDGTVVEGIRRECEDDVLVEYDKPVYMGDQFECEGDDLQGPVWCEAACSLIGSNSEDLEVDATDACRKIIRRWTVIDWCTWDPNGNSPGDDSNDTNYDRFEAVDDEWLTRDGLEWVYADYRDSKGVRRCEECVHNSGASDDVYFRYNRVDEDGYYTFDQVIKIIDLTAPVIDVDLEVQVDITGGADAKGDDFDGCEASDEVTATASDLCFETEIDASSISWYIHVEDEDGNVIGDPKSVDGPEATMTTGTGEPGDVHYIIWNVKDGCGNYTEATTEVTFVDTKNPTPVCLQDISTATMNNAEGSVTIWASDYDLGSFDNCSDVDVYFMDTAGNFVPSLTFTCADIPNGVSTTIETSLFVVDESGNYDYCFVTLRIDDNSDACADVDVGAASISGLASDAFGNRLESARIMLNQSSEAMTPVEGTYAFNDNTLFASYEIIAEKNDDFLNGVTTLDVVLLQKHILGLRTLDNPYKVISADVNGSETITATDIVELRKLILGVYTELPNNKSWRFVDAGQQFADANDPFPFTETLRISSLEGPMPNQNFVAAKIGDVSGNAFANSLQAGPRSAGRLTLEVAETTVTKGSEISVDVRGTNFTEVSGYQFTMDVSGLELTGVESGALNVTSENFGVLNANTVTTSWNSSNPVSAGNEVLFTMKFRATTDVTLSEGLKVSSRVTEALAYTGTDYAEGTVEMVYGTAENIVTAAAFELGQNEPNPFNERTVIGFVLPKAGQATLSVFDVTGKLVVEKAGEFAKGENTITLTKGELGTSGVLYYQLESGEFKATRKMILMN